MAGMSLKIYAAPDERDASLRGELNLIRDMLATSVDPTRVSVEDKIDSDSASMANERWTIGAAMQLILISQTEQSPDRTTHQVSTAWTPNSACGDRSRWVRAEYLPERNETYLCAIEYVQTKTSIPQIPLRPSQIRGAYAGVPGASDVYVVDYSRLESWDAERAQFPMDTKSEAVFRHIRRSLLTDLLSVVICLGVIVLGANRYLRENGRLS
jgi:hypothetical protein